MKYYQYENKATGRFIIKVTTNRGNIFYGDSAHQLTHDEIMHNWRNHKNNKNYFVRAN
jgi:hypothetical protein